MLGTDLEELFFCWIVLKYLRFILWGNNE